jgi:hypothetical protein
LVVLGQTLANFGRGHAYDRIEARVVIGLTSENFNSEGALFHVLGVPVESVLDCIAKKIGEPFTVAEEMAGENPLKLLPDGIPFRQR